jgi:hypothetical protein
MKQTPSPWLIGCAAAPLLAAGCVTINIYFPAAAAEKVADRIIDEVYEAKPGEAPKPIAPIAPAAPAEKK